MPFTVVGRLLEYAGFSDVTIRITTPGTDAQVNGGTNDALADTASNGVFNGTVDEDLVGVYEYTIYHLTAPIKSGWLRRLADQASVIVDDPRDFPFTIAELISAAGMTPLTGSQAITVRVKDAETDLWIENAAVRAFRSGLHETKLTDENGETTPFGLDVADWSFTISAVGYVSLVVTEVEITEDETLEYELTALSLEVLADPDLCNCLIVVVDQYGQPIDGASVTATLLSWPNEEIFALNRVSLVLTDDNGRAIISLLRLGRYLIEVIAENGEGLSVTRLIPDADTYVIPVRSSISDRLLGCN